MRHLSDSCGKAARSYRQFLAIEYPREVINDDNIHTFAL